MIIEITKLEPDGSRLEGEEPAEILELQEQKRLRVEGPVRYDLFAQLVGQELVVQGRVSAPLSFACARCLEFYSTTVEESSFLRSYEISEGVDSVDVTPDIREDILLNLPAYPVCQPECKGLCPQCGENLNRGRCTCRPPPAENRWKALDGLKLE